MQDEQGGRTCHGSPEAQGKVRSGSEGPHSQARPAAEQSHSTEGHLLVLIQSTCTPEVAIQL